jgi:hypothetical protein
MPKDKVSKGSKSSSTQQTIANFKKLKEEICECVDKLIFGFPQYRGLKHGAWMLGILFTDGKIHTIHPSDLELSKSMLRRMIEEIDKIDR